MKKVSARQGRDFGATSMFSSQKLRSNPGYTTVMAYNYRTSSAVGEPRRLLTKNSPEGTFPHLDQFVPGFQLPENFRKQRTEPSDEDFVCAIADAEPNDPWR